MSTMNLAIAFTQTDERIEVDFDTRMVYISHHSDDEIIIEFVPKDGSEPVKLVMQGQSDDDKEYFATYVIAELFSQMLERNKDCAHEQLNELYSFFSMEPTLELERTIIRFLKSRTA